MCGRKTIAEGREKFPVTEEKKFSSLRRGKFSEKVLTTVKRYVKIDMSSETYGQKSVFLQVFRRRVILSPTKRIIFLRNMSTKTQKVRKW